MTNIRNNKYQLRVNNPDAISSVDVLESVQSQYAASPRILGLLVKKAALADPGKDVMIWRDKIFNPQTAEGVGLDIWGRIVGIGRKIYIQGTDFFGFAGQNLQNFDQAPFYTQSLASGQSDLSDTAYRFLIFFKAAANISDGTMPAINSALTQLFREFHGGEGNFYVLEAGPMAIRAVFDFYLTAYEQTILEQYGLLNRPAGVDFSWYQYTPDTLFGFAGQNLQNFDNGIFTPFEYQHQTI